jgi:xylulokinase
VREWTEGTSLSAERVIMGVDVGSSSTKGVLVTVDGRLLAEAERPMVISRPRPGWAEQDADGDWWSAFVAVCRELLAATAGRPAAVGVSGLGPCLVAADGRARPLRPAILYGIDTRAAREIEELNARLGEAAILARCGSPLTSQSLGPKLAWLAREEPEAWTRTRHWFTCGSYLAYRLTGEYVLDHHSASQCGPLYDVRTNAWIDEWAAVTAPGLPMPHLAWPQETLGVVSPAAAEATGLPQGIPVASGTIDSWAEVAASGLRGSGEALLVYGTTMFLLEVGTAARPDARLWSTTSYKPGTRNLAGGIGAAGALATWLHGVTGAGSLDELFEEAAAAGPGAGGLLALPYFNGERTPLFDPDARGALFGLTTAHDRGHVLRALLEAAAFAVRHNLEVMAQAGASITALRASGGGARDGLWPGIVRDVTGLPQRRLNAGTGMATGAAAGSALLAAIALGEADLETSWARPEELRPPAPETSPLYDELYGLYRELYPATREQAHALARLQRRGDVPGGGAG